MKVAAFRCDVVEVPLAAPIKTAIHDIRAMGAVLLTLESDQGLVGEGYVFTINGKRIRALLEMLIGLQDLLVGRDPHFVEAIWQEVFVEINPIGHRGTAMAALSAIDTACWDLVGKAADLPLHRLFGAARDRIAAYASGGLWLSQSAEDCAREAEALVARGFRAVKLRLGSRRLADDLLRVRLVREAIGPDIDLLADANQSFTAKHAIRLGRELEAFDLVWLEEPVAYHDLRGHREVRQALSIPIATGETEYTRYGMKAIVEADAADVLMPDLQRIGGFSELRRAAAFAAAHDIPVSTHMFTEHSLCLAGSLANCLSVEHMPWTAPLLLEEPELVEGALMVPERPGTGFTFDRKAVARYAV